MKTRQDGLGRRSLLKTLDRDLAAANQMVKQHRRFRREVMKHRAPAHVGCFGNLIDCCLDVALTQEQVEGGFGNAGASASRFAIPQRGLRHTRRC
jgi:hypothetical protein